MEAKSDISKVTRIHEAEDFPKVVLIDNCNACNLRCSMCDHVNMKKYRRVQLMDFDLYKKIIDEIALENPDTRVWQIFFGDPFMCHDIARRVAYAKEKGLSDVVLNTNAQLMNEKKAAAIIDAGLDAMYVGIDSAKAETYEKIRVGGEFEKAVTNTLRYHELLKERGHPGQDLFVQFVESDINQAEVNDFRNFWNSQGINVKIRPKVSWAGLVDATNLQDNEALDRKPCYWLMQTINICADGRVAFCSVDVHCRVTCGDISERSIKEVWNTELKTMRNLHNEGRFGELPEMCRQCSDWQSAYATFEMAGNKE